MTHCDNCNQKNPEDAKFCESCGEKKTEELMILACTVKKDGLHTLTVDVLYEGYNNLDSDTKEFTVNFWGQFGMN